MIEGMNVLKKAEIIEKEIDPGWWIPILIGMVISAVFFIVGTLVLCKIEKKRGVEYESCKTIFLCFFGVVAIIIGFSVDAVKANYISTTPTGKYAYEVTFDSQDAFYEAYKQYEITEINSTYKDIAGKIYTIKER